MKLRQRAQSKGLRTAVLVAMGVASLVSQGNSGEPQEITAKRTSTEYLFFLDETYSLSASLSDDSSNEPREGQVRLTGLSVRIKAAPSGTQDIPETKFQCQGVRYTVPAHQIVVLGPRPTQHGVFVETAPDPNGSGNVEVLIVVNHARDGSSDRISVDHSSGHEGIQILSSSTSSSSSDDEFEWSMKLILRNTSDEPFVLKPEFFKNFPPADNWPTVVIPPANPKA